MRHLSVFNSVSVDGFFTDAHGDMSWAHAGADDPEWQDYTRSNVRGGSELLFGRKTYEMMSTYWPTPDAMKRAPLVADRMKLSPKVVFSHACDPLWSNTRCVTGDPATEVRKMKDLPGDTEPGGIPRPHRTSVSRRCRRRRRRRARSPTRGSSGRCAGGGRRRWRG